MIKYRRHPLKKKTGGIFFLAMAPKKFLHFKYLDLGYLSLWMAKLIFDRL
jgi:hypothetical protein